MRLLKLFFAVAAGLFAIITLLSLLIPSSVPVSRTVLINGSIPSILLQVAAVPNWKNWHPVFKQPGATLLPVNNFKNQQQHDIKYNGKTARLIITGADSSAVKFLLQSRGENDIENTITCTQIPQQLAVQVQWQAVNKLSWYPWQKFYGIFADKLTGPGYEAALQGLKEFIENEKP